MDAGKDNANPLILNASDLPSRRQDQVARPRADGGTGLFDGLVSGTSLDPFSNPVSSSDEDSDDPEEIDAQEVYGQSPPATKMTTHI